jgi:hypothetical protein
LERCDGVRIDKAERGESLGQQQLARFEAHQREAVAFNASSARDLLFQLIPSADSINRVWQELRLKLDSATSTAAMSSTPVSSVHLTLRESVPKLQATYGFSAEEIEAAENYLKHGSTGQLPAELPALLCSEIYVSGLRQMADRLDQLANAYDDDSRSQPVTT